VKEHLPYSDKVIFPGGKTVKKPVSNDLVNNNHDEWTASQLKEFERCQKTCLWNQQKQLLLGEEYVPFEFPFEFPKLPGWVNCNLWDGDERPTSLGPLKDDQVIWRKETKEKDPTVTNYLQLNWVETDEENWT
jgi:hypothetical protein